MATLLFVSLLLACSTGAMADPVTVARTFIARTYLSSDPYVGAKLDAALVAPETLREPAQVRVHIAKTGRKTLVALLDVYRGRVLFLSVDSQPPDLSPEDSDRRIEAVLSALEEFNGWKCGRLLTPGTRPHYREAICQDAHPAPYQLSGSNIVIFADPGGFLTMVGAPGPPSARNQ